jgi:hypothetical protein
MKQGTIYCLCLAILSISLSANAQSTGSKNSMKGAYLLTQQKGTQNNKDTIMDIKQLKLYTGNHFMYAHPVPGDTVGSFGVGTYTMQNGKVTEHVFYTSDGGAQDNSFEVAVAKTADGYTQVINFPADASGSVFVLTESYKNVSKKLASALEGAWKMTKLTEYPVAGTPTVNANPLQYKFYESGHFMFGNTETNPATQKPVANIGWGSFTVDGPNEITETPLTATYRDIINLQVKVKLLFKDKDHYQQTIVWKDGSKMIEEYERLK